MRSFLDEEKMPSSKEINNFLKSLRDDVIEIFDETLKYKNKKNEKKFIEYKKKLIEFVSQKEEIAMNLTGSPDNTGYFNI